MNFFTLKYKSEKMDMQSESLLSTNFIASIKYPTTNRPEFIRIESIDENPPKAVNHHSHRCFGLKNFLPELFKPGLLWRLPWR